MATLFGNSLNETELPPDHCQITILKCRREINELVEEKWRRTICVIKMF